jgi:2,4-diacetylphloroglucinol hydrolase
VDEYIGPDLVKIAIRFVDPAEFGFDTSAFREAGIVGHACAELSFRSPDLPMAIMVHLTRRTRDGFELRSRYWIGHRVRVNLFGRPFPVDPLLSRVGLKRRRIGLRVAYEQLLHDQIEFTRLSTFLADIYQEFGEQDGGSDASSLGGASQPPKKGC